MTVTTHLFDEGVDEAAVTTSSPGVTAVAGTVTYEAANGLHADGMGIDLVGGSGNGSYILYSVPADNSGSVYCRIPSNPGTSSCRFLIFVTPSNVINFQFRAHSNGTFGWVNSAGTLVGSASTLTWSPNVWFRIDWQVDQTVAGSSTVTARIFYDSNVEGTTPSDTVSTTISGYATATSQLRVSASTTGFTMHVDTLRLSDQLEWLGPYGESTPPEAGTVAHMWVGAPSQDGMVVVADFVGATLPELLFDDGDGVFIEGDDLGDGYWRFEIGPLLPETTFSYSLYDTPEGGLREEITTPVTVSTLPAVDEPVAEFKVAAGHCTLQEQVDGSAIEDIVAWAPLFMVHLGDFYYTNSESTNPATFQTLYEGQIRTYPGMAELCAQVPMYYCISDHEVGDDDADSDNAWNAAQRTAYNKVVPYPGGTPHYATWVVGRVRFILLDTRTTARSHGLDPDVEGKTMLGEAQKAWLFDQLVEPQLLKVIISDPPWQGPADLTRGGDKWWAYTVERQEIADFIVENAVNVDFWHGDAHLLAYTAVNDWGGFPVLCGGPLANKGGGYHDDYWDARYGGDDTIDYCQYMRVTFTDDGTTLTRVASLWDAKAGVERLTRTDTWQEPEAPTGVHFARWTGATLRPLEATVDIVGVVVS